MTTTTTTSKRKNSDTIIGDPQPDLYKGQLFPSKQAAEIALKQHALSRNFQFVVVQLGWSKYAFKCLNYKQTNCPWEVQLTRRRAGCDWTVQKVALTHACSTNLTRSPNHQQQLDVEVLSDRIKDLVASQPNMKVLALQAQLQEMFRIPVSYRKAWYAKQRAIEKTYGNWKESYKDLQTLMSKIQSTNPTSVVDWETRPGATPDHIFFKRMFWSFGPCIEGFKYCPPVIVADGTNLTGKYKGSLLTASSFDGDRNPFPLAFAIVESKNTWSWSWFISRIEKFVTDQSHICIISDMNAGLHQTIKDFGKDWVWKWCLRHYVSSYEKRYKSKIMKNLLWIAGMENQMTKFNGAMEKFLHMDAERELGGKDWVKRNQHEWSRVRDIEEGGWRMGIMTTSMVKFNGVFEDIRALPIASLVRQTFYGLVDYWDKRRLKIEAQLKTKSTDFSKYSTTIVNKRLQKANAYMVRPVDQSRERYEVRKISNNQAVTSSDVYKVALNYQSGDGSCTCGKFQSLKIPCSHAIACCRFMSVDPYAYVYDFYCWEYVEDCYKKSFSPLGDPKCWKHQGAVLLPDVCNVSPSVVPEH